MERIWQNGLITAELERSCAQEQIHLLGTVQPHGFLIVADVATQCIVQVSSGITRYWPGLADTQEMIGGYLPDWVETSAEQGGVAAFDVAPRTTARSCSNITLLSLPAAYPKLVPWRARFERTCGGDTLAASAEWECLGHRSDGLAVLEWLPQAAGEAEMRHQSRIFAEITRTLSRLRDAERLESFFKECVELVQEFSGFDRVMIYRFLPDGSGEVMAEQTSPGCRTKYLGLRFPATDIPAQARALYLTNRLRILADVEAVPDTLVPPSLQNGFHLDQGHCILRGFSPTHLLYLRNMGVRATMTLSIVTGGKLWGLIACHHERPRVPPHHVREGLRQFSELMAEVTNMRIEALIQLESVRHRLALEHLLNPLYQALIDATDFASVLDEWLPELLAAFGASNLGVRIGHVWYIGGPGKTVGSAQQVLAEVALRLQHHRGVAEILAWDDLLQVHKPALACLPEAAGLLVAQREEEEILFCFVTRPEVVEEVRWGGEQVAEPVVLADGVVRLEPRHSFEEWKQSVSGKSRAWEEADLDTLKTLLQIVGDVHKQRVTRALHEKLHWGAHHDELTGLFNRRAMETEISRRLASGQLGNALLLLDLDRFKKINDAFGLATGDNVLQQLGARLAAVAGETGLLARLGDDEFMVLLSIDHADPTRLMAFAGRLQEAAAGVFEVNGQELRVGMSIGIAIFGEHGATLRALLRRADLALCQAKAQGQCCSVIFDIAMEVGQLDSYMLERDLHDAVNQGQLKLVYQPKVDLLSRRVVGLEALVRWHHPTRGENMPAVFIPIAERSDQIVKIGRWVMQAAVAAQVQWRTEGRVPLPVAVNLSMADILSPSLVTYLTGLLRRFSMPSHTLEVEVTESCMMRELAKTQDVLLALNQQGISTTLDDFGTGFSSLSYLRQLPLQCLKIDQSFVQSMLQDVNAEKLTEAILAMGAALKMRIVAEGVETEEQMCWLLIHGCHVGQGYFFSPPVSQDDVPAVIRLIEKRLTAMR